MTSTLDPIRASTPSSHPHEHPDPQVSSQRSSSDRWEDTSRGREGGDAAQTSGGERAVPYHCPFCAEEDLRPLGDRPGAWHCRSCLRAFSVRFLGLQSIPDPSGGPR